MNTTLYLPAPLEYAAPVSVISPIVAGSVAAVTVVGSLAE